MKVKRKILQTFTSLFFSCAGVFEKFIFAFCNFLFESE